MSLFYYIIIMLVAILISNLINRFVPSISIPIIQIALGICVALIPLDFTLQLNPELFLILFIAPLLYNDSMLSDKKSLWAYRKPITMIAFGLVFITVVGVGYLVNLLIPSIPLAAAFALAASLAPTDAVAVSSLATRIDIPHPIMDILEGESLINDSSGIVSFQFAVVAMVTGGFSLVHAGTRLVVVAIGGILLGLLFALCKYKFVTWIRSLGMENITLHILIGVLTPFFVYMVAELMEVSGILAVVACGIAQPSTMKKLNPEMVRFNLASNSIWSVLSFTLNGLVFLILGTQLPSVMKVVWDKSSVDNMKIVGCIVAFTTALLLIRFLWSLLTIDKKHYASEEQTLTKIRASVIICLCGVRGTVTLATAMSIPFLLSDHSPFPERDLIIFIASGVILCTLLLSNFVLPLLFKSNRNESVFESESDACVEIFHNVIMELNHLIDDENRLAATQIIWEYNSRSTAMQQKHSKNAAEEEEEHRLKLMALAWERQNTNELLLRGQVDEVSAQHYLDIIDIHFGLHSNHKFISVNRLRRYAMWMKHLLRFGMMKSSKSVDREKMVDIRSANHVFVLEKLKELKTMRDTPVINKMIGNYELSLAAMQSGLHERGKPAETNISETSLADMAAVAFQIERDNIQEMFENGRISRETSKDMRKNISILEAQIKIEDI